MTATGAEPVRLHHRVDGDPTAPALLLGPAVGLSTALWDPQVEALAEHWRVIRFDTRGHGDSPVPAGPYSIEGLADDVLALANDLGVDQFAYCGLSLGGAIGQQLAADEPDRIRSLVLCCTAPYFGEHTDWHGREQRVRAEGTEWLLDASRERWFTPAFREREPDQVERMLDVLRRTPPEGYASCCAALAAFDSRGWLDKIKAPTLVVAGADDPATPPELGEEMAEGIDGATLQVVRDAAHLANIERPDEVSEAVVEHLRRTSP
jgi:3-oxoadipate enol-lactonase